MDKVPLQRRVLDLQKEPRASGIEINRSLRPLPKSANLHSRSLILKLPLTSERDLDKSASSSLLNYRKNVRPCTIHIKMAIFYCSLQQSLFQVSGNILRMKQWDWLGHPAYLSVSSISGLNTPFSRIAIERGATDFNQFKEATKGTHQKTTKEASAFFSNSLLNNPTNPRTSEPPKCTAQTRSLKLSSFHSSYPQKIHIFCSWQPSGLILANPPTSAQSLRHHSILLPPALPLWNWCHPTWVEMIFTSIQKAVWTIRKAQWHPRPPVTFQTPSRSPTLPHDAVFIESHFPHSISVPYLPCEFTILFSVYNPM